MELADKIRKFLPHLNEKQQRLYLASEAEALGHGGVQLVAKASSVSHTTIIKGKKELNGSASVAQTREFSSRIRKKGGGRKSLEEKDMSLIQDLDALMEPVTRGCPESVLKWTCLSTRTLAAKLRDKSHSISHTKAGQLLEKQGFSLQSNAKRLEGNQHPDRNEQFLYINNKAESYISKGFPVISVDTKKKELVGNYKNSGKEYRPKKTPREVNMHDFGKDKAAPYGVYDIAGNEGFVNVGTSCDTSAFAVHSIGLWWKTIGEQRYGGGGHLLITADGGGSNSYRTKLWKTELQKLADETSLEITVCHFPPGTSKWNKIEHRLFCHISRNWKGIPLKDYETIVQLIGAVKTEKGLKVRAVLDTNEYKKGIVITDEELLNVNIHRHEFHPEWNYTICPKK